MQRKLSICSSLVKILQDEIITWAGDSQRIQSFKFSGTTIINKGCTQEEMEALIRGIYLVTSDLLQNHLSTNIQNCNFTWYFT
jgi:hypothetical protein